jgi:hypothetical protein
MSSAFIFNQYYIDFLKRLKTEAKKDKTDDVSSKILSSIKENYTTFDKASDEYLVHLNKNIPEDVWKSFTDDAEDWLKNNGDINIFINISLSDVTGLLKDDYLCIHFISVFYIFKKELSEEVSANIVKILQSINSKDLVENIEVNDDIKKVLDNLQEIRNKKVKDKSGIDMKFIEDTTLGKLAREILEDVDVGKLQKSMGEKGDVLKAIGDPDSGFADIITNVSKKMATKISNGDLKQENLIEDAMKFASSMPGLFGGGSNGGNGGNGSNDSNGGSSTGSNKAPDLSGMMNMMSAMMGGMGGGGGNFANMFNDLQKGNKSGKSSKGTRTTVNESAYQKLAKAKQLKKKLQERKKAVAAAATKPEDND